MIGGGEKFVRGVYFMTLAEDLIDTGYFDGLVEGMVVCREACPFSGRGMG